MKKCPACGRAAEVRAEECPNCFLIFSKFEFRPTPPPSARQSAPAAQAGPKLQWMKPGQEKLAVFVLALLLFDAYLIMTPPQRPEDKAGAPAYFSEEDRPVPVSAVIARHGKRKQILAKVFFLSAGTVALGLGAIWIIRKTRP
ncbi:MAG: hypothetical protein HY611_01430 [Elusimicrobia bacterium]|nr:hypothetical protein [Elusimicrobiota bacterium]